MPTLNRSEIALVGTLASVLFAGVGEIAIGLADYDWTKTGLRWVRLFGVGCLLALTAVRVIIGGKQ